MTRRYIAILRFAAATLLGGCASYQKSEITSPSEEFQPSGDDSKSLNAPPLTESEVLSLNDASSLTLTGSPELKTFSLAERMAEAKIIQAGVTLNPEVSLTVEDAFGSGGYSKTEEVQTTLQLSQVIELGDKRSGRLAVASAARDQLLDAYEIKRIEVLSAVTEKFIRTAADQQLLQLSLKAEQIAKDALTNIQHRTAAGGVSELEAVKARVLLARAHIAAEHVEHEFESDKRELAAHWGNDRPRFSRVRANLFKLQELPGYEELEGRIINSPEIRQWVNHQRLAEAELQLARAKGVSNLQLGGGPRRFEGTDDHAWVAQLSIPLPLFDRNVGGITDAQAAAEKIQLDKESTHLRLKTALFGLYQEMKHAKTEVELMRSEIIPQAERALSVAQESFHRGNLSYLELVDSQRTLLEVYRENIEAAYSFHHYINAIERLCGAPLTSTEIKRR